MPEMNNKNTTPFLINFCRYCSKNTAFPQHPVPVMIFIHSNAFNIYSYFRYAVR